MPLTLPGAIIAAVIDATGALTITSSSGETMPAGTVPVGTKAWPDEYGRLVLEAPNGEQTRLGSVTAPTEVVYRGGGSATAAGTTTALAGPAAVVLARRWSTPVTTGADGAVTVNLPAGLFGAVWSVAGTCVLAMSMVAVTAVSANAVGLQVWTGTGVLLGGATLAKPSAPVQVLLEVAGSIPS